MQLQHKIFSVLAILSGVPLLVLLFGVLAQMEEGVRERSGTEIHARLDKMAEELSLILENQKAIAKGLTKVPAVHRFATVSSMSGDGMDTKLYQQRADELEQFFLNYQHAVPSIQALRYIDANGKSLVKIKEGKSIEPKLEDSITGRLFIADQSNKRFFQYAMNSKEEVTMSDFELGQVTREADFCPAMVRYVVKLQDEVDSLDGFLVVNIWGNRLDSTMETAMGGYPGKAYIVEISDDSRRDGVYLYHAETRQRFADQLNSPYKFNTYIGEENWQQIRMAEQSGSLMLNNERLLFYKKLSPFMHRTAQWLLVVDSDRQAMLADIDDIRQSIWYLLGILLLISLLMAIWASGRLAKPVHELANIIKRYADGERDVSYTEQRRDEIGVAGQAFNYMKYRLEKTEAEKTKAERFAQQSERLASVGQLAAGIGHEINNPLMNILSLASLIEAEVTDNRGALDDIALLKKESKRCARIVQGILSFARESTPSYRYFDMSQLITETVKLLQHRAEGKSIRLQLDVDEGLFMYGDADQLQQVLVNVLLNAVQASAQDGRVQIKAISNSSFIMIDILDFGDGIPKDNIAHIFDPFFTTKAEGEGTGLGLSVSYGIIERHGGTIHIINDKSAGVRVNIILPVSMEKEEEKNNAKEAGRGSVYAS